MLQIPPTKMYSLTLIFDSECDHVLLQRKDRGLFSGKLNAVGGKIEENDVTKRNGAIREVKEETGLDVFTNMMFFEHLSTNICEDRSLLCVYYSIMNPDAKWTQIESEELCLVKLTKLFEMDDDEFADDLKAYIIAAIIDLQTSYTLAKNEPVND